MGNLTREHSRFFGRTDIVATIGAEFDNGAQLVTILGPAGMGKTRVAAQFASSVEEAWFADLTAARGEQGLLSVLGRVLDVSLAPARESAEVAIALGRVPPIAMPTEYLERHSPKAIAKDFASRLRRLTDAHQGAAR